jgi:hypothetical protein
MGVQECYEDVDQYRGESSLYPDSFLTANGVPVRNGRLRSLLLIRLQHMSIQHPLLAIVGVVGTVAGFVFLLQLCVKRDLRENGSGMRLD